MKLREQQAQPLSEQFDRLPTSELLEILSNGRMLRRAHALNALVRRSGQDKSLLKHVVEAIADPRNINSKLIGTISVSHKGLAELLKVGTSEAKRAVTELLEAWPEPDRSDLFWLLASEGLSLNDTVPQNAEGDPTRLRV